MKVVVFGGSGQLGSDIVKSFDNVVAPSHNELNLMNNDQQIKDYLTDHKPDVLINCAAYHQVAQCQEHPHLAFKLNCEVLFPMVKMCNMHGTKLVHISTDYVFSGKNAPYHELSKCNPLNVYGESKLSGERYIAAHSKDFIIGRVSSLFGPKGSSNKGPNFIERIKQSTGELTMVSDQYMSPTYTIDCVNLLKQLIKDDVCGMVHLNNSGSCSWYEFASEIVNLYELDLTLKPVNLNNTLLPLNTTMISNVIESRSWRDGLVDYKGE